MTSKTQTRAAIEGKYRALLADITPRLYQDGLSWYAKAHDVVRLGAAATRLDPEVLAHVLSALSSNTGWSRNLTAFRLHIEAYTDYVRDGNRPDVLDVPYTPNQGGTLYHTSDRKAWAVLCDGTVEGARVLIGKGQKTRAFARNIVEAATLPDGENAVTIDSIMARGAGYASKDREKVYADIQFVVEKLAAEYGILPYQMQAVIWVAIRGTAE